MQLERDKNRLHILGDGKQRNYIFMSMIASKVCCLP
jgi:hypothetical protein